MGEITVAEYYHNNKQTLNTLIRMGIVSCNVKRDFEIYKLFKQLESKYPSLTDRYHIISTEMKICTRTVRYAINKMQKPVTF